eukprot:GHVP01056112.1.p1 GENE.GHVP01056112.1~~GHVP01056112.1.p1  ORF type:complete len:199 (-),score=30.68 GHVP01056112.1:65-661(-)
MEVTTSVVNHLFEEDITIGKMLCIAKQQGAQYAYFTKVEDLKLEVSPNVNIRNQVHCEEWILQQTSKEMEISAATKNGACVYRNVQGIGVFAFNGCLLLKANGRYFVGKRSDDFPEAFTEVYLNYSKAIEHLQELEITGRKIQNQNSETEDQSSEVREDSSSEESGEPSKIFVSIGTKKRTLEGFSIRSEITPKKKKS